MPLTSTQAGLILAWFYILIYAAMLEINREFGMEVVLISVGITILLIWIWHKMGV